MEQLGVLTARFMDTDAVTSVVATRMPSGPLESSYEAVLAEPDLQPLVHELLTVRILEQHDRATIVLDGMRALAASICVDLSPTQIDSVAEEVFTWIDGACCEVVDKIDSSDPSVRSAIQQLAGLSSIDATLKHVDQTMSELLLRTPEVRRDDVTFRASYLRTVARRYAKIILPDLDTERAIPVEDIYVPTEISIEDHRTILEPEKLISETRRTVILGQPGGGKSTLTGILLYRMSKEQKSIPFLVVLRKYGKDFQDGLSFVQHIEKSLNSDYQQAPRPGWVERMLSNGSAVVLFDGLDELLDSTKRREIRNAVDAFCQQYPFTRVLVTSRIVGYDQAPLPTSDFVTARLGEFDPASVHLYVQKWFNNVASELNYQDRATRTENFMRESESVSDLRTNPLLLSLMCVLYRGSNYIPENRLGLYEECAKLLFKKWDRSRDINVSLELGSDIDSSLMHLALWMLESGHDNEGLPEQTLVRVCAENLVPRRYEQIDDAIRVAEEFVHFCRDRAWVLAEAGTTEQGETRFTFTHRTFLEYYAASQLARLCGTPEKMAERIAPRIAASEWDVVGQLVQLIANKNHDYGGDRFTTSLLAYAGKPDQDFASRLRTLEFVGRGLHYLLPSPGVAREITRAVYDGNIRHGSDAASLAGPVGKDKDPLEWESTHATELSAICLITGAPMQTLATVADELARLLSPELDAMSSDESAQNSRRIALATRARTICERPDRSLGIEFYGFWADWSLSVCSGRIWDLAVLDAGGEDAATGLLELCQISIGDYLEKYPAGTLWAPQRTGELGLARLGTLTLLAGYIDGNYYDEVFIDGAVERILQGLFTWIAAGVPPLRRSDVRHRIRRASSRRVRDSRWELLSEESLTAAVVLQCLTAEVRSGPLTERPRETDDEVVADPGSGKPQEPKGHPAALLVRALIVCRATGVQFVVPDAAASVWQSLPSEARGLLAAWGDRQVSFWDAETEPATEAVQD